MLKSFPSPIGELHFSILFVDCANKTWGEVSVPYRGATFLNHIQLWHTMARYCFRPLSGSYISQ